MKKTALNLNMICVGSVNHSLPLVQGKVLIFFMLSGNPHGFIGSQEILLDAVSCGLVPALERIVSNKITTSMSTVIVRKHWECAGSHIGGWRLQ